MSDSYLIDTSVLVLSLQGNSEIRQRLNKILTNHMSAISLGELCYGAEHSVNVGKSLIDVNELVKTFTVLLADDATARIYGRIKDRQAKKGQMLPDNDLWIAATALQYNLTLIARDHHFDWITDLVVEQW